jgi:hypothetical protein
MIVYVLFVHKKPVSKVVACSVDSHFTHLAWMNTPRSEGGLGRLDIPLLSDLTHTISKVGICSKYYLWYCGVSAYVCSCT